MNSFDYILIALVTLLSIRGYTIGFKNALINFVGVVGGVYLAVRLAPELSVFLNDNFLHLNNLDFLRSGVFLALFSLAWVLTGFMKQYIGDNDYKYYQKSFLNNMGGVIVSIFKNIAVFSIVVMLLGSNKSLYSGYIKTIKDSASYQSLFDLGEKIMPMHNIEKNN